MSRLLLTAAPPAPGVKDPGPALCFDWDALAARPGADATAWEHHFPLEDAGALEAVTLGLVRGWHMDGDKDLSLFEDLSLGRASRWLLWQLAVQPGVKCFAALTAAAKSSGATGFVLDASVPAPYRAAARAAAGALGLALEESGAGGQTATLDAWKAPSLEYDAARRAAMRGLDIISRRRGRGVVCASYHNLDPVLPELARLGLHPIFADCPPKSRLATLAVMGAGAWPQPHSPSRWSSAERVTLEALGRRRSPALDALCRWKGLSFRSFMEPLLDAVASADFPACAWAGRRLRERFRASRPAALLLPYDGPPLQQLLQQVARLERTPSAMMLHGLPFSYVPRLEHADSDRLLVWGPEQAALFRAAFPGLRVDAPGNPVFDRYSGGAPAPGGRELLALTHPLNRWSSRASVVDPERYALAVASAAAESGWSVTLKLHPSESLSRYERLLAGRPVRLAREEPLEPLLRRSALVVGSFSTVLVEALLLGRPALCVNLSRDENPPPFDGRWGVETVHDAAALRRRLEEALKDPARLRPDASRLLAGFAGPADGGSARRVAAAVAEIAQIRGG